MRLRSEKNNMPKKIVGIVLNFLRLQKFTQIKILIFLLKILTNKFFQKNKKKKFLTAENIFIFFRLIADINKQSRKRG